MSSVNLSHLLLSHVTVIPLDYRSLPWFVIYQSASLIHQSLILWNADDADVRW